MIPKSGIRSALICTGALGMAYGRTCMVGVVINVNRLKDSCGEIMKTRYMVFFLLVLVAGCTEQPDPAEQNAAPQTKSIPAFQNPDNIYDAALQGDIETVKRFLDGGFDVNRSNQDRQSLLMLSGFNGHTDLCKLLIEKGAEIDSRDYMGRTALMFAATGPFAETVRFLLESGADTNAVDRNEHFTALMHAAAEGHLEVVKVLLEHGADKSAKDIDGDTAESFARRNGHNAVVDYIESYK